MGKRQARPSDSSNRNAESSEPGGEHVPRSYTAREQFLFGAKLFIIAGILVLVIWLLNRYV
jgi:hypothetical protein